jgi:hypothetical protein
VRGTRHVLLGPFDGVVHHSSPSHGAFLPSVLSRARRASSRQMWPATTRAGLHCSPRSTHKQHWMPLPGRGTQLRARMPWPLARTCHVRVVKEERRRSCWLHKLEVQRLWTSS